MPTGPLRYGKVVLPSVVSVVWVPSSAAEVVGLLSPSVALGKLSPVSWRTLNVFSYSSSAVHSVGERVETQPDSPHSGRAPAETMTAWYFASVVPFASVSESVAAVIGACPGEVMIESKGTPSR